MLALQSLGYTVSFVAAGAAVASDKARSALEDLGIGYCSAPVYSSVEDVLRRQAGCFDVIYLHRYSVAARYVGLARSYHPRARVLYSVADLHHLRVERQAAVEARPELLTSSKHIRTQELIAAWSADAVITHSAFEASLLEDALPQTPVHRVPWSVMANPVKTAWASRQGIAFVGNYRHAPNRDAATWLAEEVMPLVWQTRPGLECFMIGRDMPRAVRKLARPGIVAVGGVEDLHGTVFEHVRLTVAPLRYGAGIKGKVLDSLAAGIPCVMTQHGAEGLTLPRALKPLVGRDAAALSAMICRLHDDKPACHKLSQAGLSWIKQEFSVSRVADGLKRAIEGRNSSETATPRSPTLRRA
jgi:glycosyltransferase involved in cell wall biosynthesis